MAVIGKCGDALFGSFGGICCRFMIRQAHQRLPAMMSQHLWWLGAPSPSSAGPAGGQRSRVIGQWAWTMKRVPTTDQSDSVAVLFYRENGERG